MIAADDSPETSQRATTAQAEQQVTILEKEIIRLHSEIAHLLQEKDRATALYAAAKEECEKKLLEVEQQMRLAESAVRLGMWAWNVEEDRIWCTPAAMDLLGLTPGREVSLRDILDHVYPADRDHVQRAAQAVMDSGIGEDLEFRVALPDEEIRWIALKGDVGRDEAGRLFVTGVIVDVTPANALRSRCSSFAGRSCASPGPIWWKGPQPLSLTNSTSP